MMIGSRSINQSCRARVKHNSPAFCKAQAVHRLAERSQPSEDDVLTWVHGSSNELLALASLPHPRVRGLVALQDVKPNQLLLSVPFSKIYMSAPEHELELHWSAEMALRLLEHQHGCKKSHDEGQFTTAAMC